MYQSSSTTSARSGESYHHMHEQHPRIGLRAAGQAAVLATGVDPGLSRGLVPSRIRRESTFYTAAF